MAKLGTYADHLKIQTHFRSVYWRDTDEYPQKEDNISLDSRTSTDEEADVQYQNNLAQMATYYDRSEWNTALAGGMTLIMTSGGTKLTRGEWLGEGICDGRRCWDRCRLPSEGLGLVKNLRQ